MNKEEILNKSKAENKYTDEREKTILISSYAIGATAGLVICVLFQIVEGLILHRNTAHLTVIFNGILFAKYLVDAIRIKKSWQILMSLLFGVAFLLCIIRYFIILFL